jgi:hypothetical protein
MKRAAEKSKAASTEDGGKRARKQTLPKKSLSAYNFYFRKERATLLKKYADGDTSQPDFDTCLNEVREKGNWKKESEVLFQAASRTIANRWKAMEKEDRAPFDKLAGEALAIYRKEMKEYEDKMMEEALREARSINTMGGGAAVRDGPLGGAYPGGIAKESPGAAGADVKPAAIMPPASSGSGSEANQNPALAHPGTGIYAYDLSNLTTAFAGAAASTMNQGGLPFAGLPLSNSAFGYPGLPVANFAFPGAIAPRSIEQLILEERLRVMQQHQQQQLQLLTGSLQPGRSIQQHFLLPPGAQHPTSVLDVSLLGRLDESAAQQRGTNPPAPSAEDPNLLARLMDELQRRNPRPPL